MQKRAFRFLYDNCDSSYESVVKLAGESTMNVTRLRSLCIEIFETLNSINPTFMNDIFELRKTNRAIRNQYKPNLEVPIINQVNLGAKSIRYLGPEIWKTLSFHIKSSESLTTKNYKKLGYGVMQMFYLSALECGCYIMIHAQ